MKAAGAEQAWIGRAAACSHRRGCTWRPAAPASVHTSAVARRVRGAPGPRDCSVPVTVQAGSWPGRRTWHRALGRSDPAW